MGLSDALQKAAAIMIRRGVPVEEQQQISEILVQAGWDHAIDSAKRVQEYEDSLVQKAFSGGIVH